MTGVARPRGTGAARVSLRLLLPAVVVLPLAIQAAGAWMAWSTVWDQARAEVAHTADAAAEYARNVLDLHRMRAARALELVRGMSDEEIRRREPELHATLRAMNAAEGLGPAFRLYIFDRDGQILVNTDFLPSPAGSYRDRDYFRRMQAPDVPGTLVGEAAMGRANSLPFFPITLRRVVEGSGPEAGAFDGLVNVSVGPDSLAKGLARLRGPPGDRLSLVRDDGAILARTAPPETPPPWRQAADSVVLTRMTAGETRFERFGPSPIDGAERLAAYRKVEGWPVYAAAARDRAAVVAHWRERVAALLAVGLPATVALALLALLVMRAWRGEAAARRGLEERVCERTAELARRTAELATSEERLRLALEAADLGTWEVDVRSGLATRSPRTAVILGYPAADLTAPLETWSARVHPQDRAAAVGAFDALRHGESERYHVEYRVIRPDGRVTWVESCARAVERDAAGRPLRVAGTLQDVTERREAEERRALLAREVDHRAKNALAVVQAALRLTPRGDPDVYAAAVEGRVSALARAHTLLAEHSWAGAELRELLAGELSAFLPEAGVAPTPRAELTGPALQVAASATQSFSLAFHELATNAVKYGALSMPGGRLCVTWDVAEAAAQLRITWRESGGPALAGIPVRRGFGGRVIAATVREQLGGALDQRWLPDGLEVEMRLPLDRVRAAAALPAPALEPAG